MNCFENEYVCSVKKENNLGYYRLHSIWKENGFFLNIASKEGAWRGEMTADDVMNFSGQLNLDPGCYLKECKKALTTHNGQSEMTYAVENGCFTWKKVDDQDSGIKIKMGSIMLQPAAFIDTIQNLVTAALDCNKKLQDQITELTKENGENSKKKQELQKKLDEFIQIKESMENDLYAKFLLLLNSKKKRIEELEIYLSEKNKTSLSHLDKESTSFHNPYEVDTECDSDGLNSSTFRNKRTDKNLYKSRSKNKVKKKRSKESSVVNTSLKNKIFVVNEDSSNNFSFLPKDVNEEMSLDQNINKNKSEFPSTKDELLDFFYGES